jgi:hypothetical protein
MNTQHTSGVAWAEDPIPASRLIDRVPALKPRVKEVKGLPRLRGRQAEVESKSQRAERSHATLFEGVNIETAFEFVVDPNGEDRYEAGFSAFRRQSRAPSWA